MMPRMAKAVFYQVFSPVMWLNGRRHRYFGKIRSQAVKKVHLGPGQKKYLDGWINIDANMFTGKCDVWADIRHPLPFPDNSVDAAYSHHVVEHLPNLKGHFQELYRILKQGGIYRVGGPSGDSAIRKFVEGDLDWFGDFPDRYESIGGRFANFIFCRNEHLTILTESLLQEVAQSAGFQRGKVLRPTETCFPGIFRDCTDIESERTMECPHTLIMEFRK